MLGIILQARVGSSRLPSKMLKYISEESTLFEYIVSKLKVHFSDLKIILATTQKQEDEALVRLANKLEIDYFCGEDEDVLARFIQCAENYGIREIIRVCADNPLINIGLLKELIKASQDYNEVDYLSYSVSTNPVIKTHFGIFAEYVKLNSLQKINELTDLPLYHEHVTNYLYTYPDIFKIKLIEIPELLKFKDIRLTIDTEEDFNNIKNILEKQIDTEDYIKLFEFVKNDHEILSSMKIQIERNEK